MLTALTLFEKLGLKLMVQRFEFSNNGRFQLDIMDFLSSSFFFLYKLGQSITRLQQNRIETGFLLISKVTPCNFTFWKRWLLWFFTSDFSLGSTTYCKQEMCSAIRFSVQIHDNQESRNKRSINTDNFFLFHASIEE